MLRSIMMERMTDNVNQVAKVELCGMRMRHAVEYANDDQLKAPEGFTIEDMIELRDYQLSLDCGVQSWSRGLWFPLSDDATMEEKRELVATARRRLDRLNERAIMAMESVDSMGGIAGLASAMVADKVRDLSQVYNCDYSNLLDNLREFNGIK